MISSIDNFDLHSNNPELFHNVKTILESRNQESIRNKSVLNKAISDEIIVTKVSGKQATSKSFAGAQLLKR